MYIKVRVYPGVRKEVIKKLGENRYEMHVKEKAERNMVNEKLRAILADEYSVDKKTVRLVSGHHSPSKIFSVN
tara:strand:+ start:404 stop:622 length:219 start_codon:yes stop_codon:yes gene_type:complete